MQCLSADIHTWVGAGGPRPSAATPARGRTHGTTMRNIQVETVSGTGFFGGLDLNAVGVSTGYGPASQRFEHQIVGNNWCNPEKLRADKNVLGLNIRSLATTGATFRI